MHIRDHARARPDVDAVVLYPSGNSVTFGELEAGANRLAHWFRDRGLRPGDAIALLMENNQHVHTVMWAARRCGLYYVPINTHLTATEAAYILTDSNAKVVVGSSRFLPLLNALKAALPDEFPASRLIVDGALDGWFSYPQCVTHQPSEPISDETEGDLLQYSSGTTGRPKGIRRPLPGTTPAETPNQLLPLLVALGLTAESVYLSPAPLYHTAPAAWSMAAQAYGVTTVVMERFDPRDCLDAIARHRVTHGQFVPAMFVRMLKLDDSVRHSYDMSSLRRVVHAAAPCPTAIKSAMIDWWGPIVDEFYSSSEAAGITYITAAEWLDRPGSVGRSLLGIPHVVGPDGKECPLGTDGDIYFEGGYDFEYLNSPHKTADTRNRSGWRTVGDVGHLDEDGYLYLTDRRNHMIISGGVNIYPQEAENLLIEHPKVMDAAVFGIPDAEMGQSVKAVVQLVDSADSTAEFAAELIEWTRDRLAHYKCPRSVSFVNQLPRTDTGKLVKRDIVARYS